MPFDWNELSAHADNYIAPHVAPHDQAAKRAAINRCYYAAYHHALSYAVKHKGFTKRSGPNHGPLRECLKTGTSYGASKKFQNLRLLREGADYDENSTYNANDIDFAIATRNDIIRMLKI